MNYKLLKELILGIILLFPIALSAQHYEMVKVDGKRVILVWEDSYAMDDSAPVLMPEDYDVPFIVVNSTSWVRSTKIDSTFWNQLGKQLWGRDCKIEPVPYVHQIDLIRNESIPLISNDNQDKSVQRKTPDSKLYNTRRLNTYLLPVLPVPTKEDNIFKQKGNAQNVWQKYYSPPYGSLSYDFSETYDGGYLICGFIRNIDYPYYGYIVKTDINGEKLWQKIIDGNKASMLYSSNKTADGGFIAGGTYNAKGTREDAYVIKFNACAEPEWCSVMPDEEHNGSSTTDLGIYETQDGDFLFHEILLNQLSTLGALQN